VEFAWVCYNKTRGGVNQPCELFYPAGSVSGVQDLSFRPNMLQTVGNDELTAASVLAGDILDIGLSARFIGRPNSVAQARKVSTVCVCAGAEAV